jgi:hypothetical protein
MKTSVRMSDANPIMAARPFHLSASAVNGPKLRASVDSFALKIGTSDAYVRICTDARNQIKPVLPGLNTWSMTDSPVVFSAITAHTNPSIARRPLTVSGAGPSKAKMLHGEVSPVSGRRSTSGRPYAEPGVGFSPKIDRCSDSSLAWCSSTSSLVIVFFVALSIGLTNDPSSPDASQRTRPAREVRKRGAATTLLTFVAVREGKAIPPRAAPLMAVRICDVMAAIVQNVPCLLCMKKNLLCPLSCMESKKIRCVY